MYCGVPLQRFFDVSGEALVGVRGEWLRQGRRGKQA